MVVPTREQIAAILAQERSAWCLQERIAYAPALTTPDGAGVKVEIPVMLLRPRRRDRPQQEYALDRLVDRDVERVAPVKRPVRSPALSVFDEERLCGRCEVAGRIG